ncbi:MAG: glycosyltransferase [Candidatus Omnitrophica bacterium]|nr:glycosyltransferase [Candidatus Omnitrophota bacterium]
MENQIYYSVIVPFYNEEDSVEELLGSLTSVMEKLGKPYEILACDDGSTDHTRRENMKMSSVNPAIVPFGFRANRGQTACLAEGIKRAKGEVVISLDGDLQDCPSDIPALLDEMEATGADAVCGWRKGRNDATGKTALSRLGNSLQRLLLNVPVHDISCTLRVYRAQAIKKIRLEQKGLHRYIPYLLQRAGFRLAEKEVNHKPRRYGSSKYSLRKAPQTVKLFFGLISGKY